MLIDVLHIGREVGAAAPRSGILLVGVDVVVGVRASGVLGETVGELKVDSDGASDDRHLVLGERTGLVGADDGSVGHGLAGAEDADEEVLLGHATGGESEGESDGERKSCVQSRLAVVWRIRRDERTFGNGDNDDGDGDDEDLDEVLRLLVRGPVGVGAERDKELDHCKGRSPSASFERVSERKRTEGAKENETSGGTELGDEFGERVELELERSLFRVSAKGCQRRKASALKPTKTAAEEATHTS